jgi:predicted nucleotidyltransferase
MVLARMTAEKLSRAEMDDLVQRAVEWLCTKFKPRAIWLFGSVARYDATDFSDLDVAVIFDSEEALKAARTAGIFHLSGHIGRPVDMLLFTHSTFMRKTQTGGVCETIFDEGKCLYDSQA